jgi:hypothetical protein
MIVKNNDVFFDINSSVKELETLYKINQASLRQSEEENDSLKAINYSLRTSNENERTRRKHADAVCEWNLVFMIVGWIVAFVAIANCMLGWGG